MKKILLNNRHLIPIYIHTYFSVTLKKIALNAIFGILTHSMSAIFDILTH